MSELAERIARLTPAQQELLRLRAQQPPPAKEGIAVIGMACRFPGARDTEAFWQLLHDGVDAIAEIPPSRWDIDAFYDPRPATPGRMNTRWAGLIDGMDDFDPAFFGISPREAERMDPQQRQLLEVAWHAIEDAGLSAHELAGSQTGVFVAICGGDFGRAQAQDLAGIDGYVATGGASSIAANRLSYFLDLRGPSLAVDTACSSSLVAIHLASQSLRQRECDLAVVGGVNLLLSPDMTVAFSQAHMMASDGRCKTFDERADGYVRSEGCAVLVLRRSDDARSHGDRIRAVVRGSAVNQDGRSNGLTAPNGPAQQAVIRQSLSDAGVEAAAISYIEVHGTGTPLGDPIEVHALTQVIAPGRSLEHPCVIGSVKTNIGHLEAAAGMAGVIKVILAMEHGQIPPHLHLAHLNPRIVLAGLPIDIATSVRAWPAVQGGRLAGVSAFGFGGTNAHVILGDPPAVGAAHSPMRERSAQILTLSARTAPALRALAAACAQTLNDRPAISWADACYTSHVGRCHFEHRLALVASTIPQAVERLRAVAAGQPARGCQLNQLAVNPKPPGVVFLFTGQGAPLLASGRTLYDQEPVFRGALDQCAYVCRGLLERPMLEALNPGGPQRAQGDGPAYEQVVHFSLSYALAQQWRAWGIHPAAVLGHGLGEYAAACVAGVISAADAARLLVARARLVQGLMGTRQCAAVRADESQVAALIGGFAGALTITEANGPQETIIAGSEPALSDLLAALMAQGIMATRLDCALALPPGALEPLIAPFAEACARVTMGGATIPVISTVTGAVAGDGLVQGRDYWPRQLRSPVRYAAALRAALARGYRAFLELGPRPLLTALGQQVLAGEAVEWLSLHDQGGDAGEDLQVAAARLHVLGAPISWVGYDQGRQRRRTALPGYPFERQDMRTCPLQRSASPAAHAGAQEGPAHPLLGRRISSPVTQLVQFAAHPSIAAQPYLRDHRVYGATVLPATAYLEMALAAGRSQGLARCQLTQVTISRPFIVPDAAREVLQLVLSLPASPGQPEFQIFSRAEQSADGGADERGSWVLHAHGRCRPAGDAPPSGAIPALAESRAACTTAVEPTAFYQALAARGFAYGAAFQGLRRAWMGQDQALAEVQLGEDMRAGAADYLAHPALLDACCQVLGVLASASAAHHPEVYVPVGLDELALDAALPALVFVVARLRPSVPAHASLLVADLVIYDQDGQCRARLAGLRYARVTREALLGVTAPLAAPAAAPSPLASAAVPALRRTLQAAAPGERAGLLRAFLNQRITAILGRGEVALDPAQPLPAIGFDSLMAGELSLDIEDALGTVIPLERFRDVSTIERITALLLEQVADGGAPAVPAGEVDLMSDDEVERQLRTRLGGSGS